MPRGSNRSGDTDGSNFRSRQTKAGFKTNRAAEFAGWVNASIPDANKDDFHEFETSERCLKAMNEVGSNHIRLSVVFDLQDGVYVASAFHMNEASPSGGLMVSQRSPDALRALMKLVYLITELMPLDWSELLSARKNEW